MAVGSFDIIESDGAAVGEGDNKIATAVNRSARYACAVFTVGNAEC